MSQSRLLVVHPETEEFDLLRSMLQTLGHKVDEVATDRSAVRALERQAFDLVLAGVDPNDPDSLELLSYVKRKHPGAPVILLFTEQNRDCEREAIRRGAADVLIYPLPANDVRASVTQILEQHGKPGVARSNPANGRSEMAPRNSGPNGSASGSPGVNGHAKSQYRVEPPLGEDAAIRKALDLATTIAPARTPVLITGERGTGKTMLARFIHQCSPRREGPFVEVSAQGVNELAVDRDLFGGGGDSNGPDRLGKAARAHLGTLVIDEIGALGLSSQAKLVRMLDEGVYEANSTGEPIRVDLRLICHTREDLIPLVERGEFRQDLFFRINVINLALPPLRHRLADIERLAEQFRARSAHEHQKKVSGFAPEAIEAMLRHSWTGNVAELKSAVERGVVHCRGALITPAHLALTQVDTRPSYSGGFSGKSTIVVIRPLKDALEDPEKQIIIHALELLNWNRQETAKALDINRTTLYKKMKKYGLLVDERDRAMMVYR